MFRICETDVVCAGGEVGWAQPAYGEPQGFTLINRSNLIFFNTW